MAKFLPPYGARRARRDVGVLQDGRLHFRLLHLQHALFERQRRDAHIALAALEHVVGLQAGHEADRSRGDLWVQIRPVGILLGTLGEVVLPGLREPAAS